MIDFVVFKHLLDEAGNILYIEDGHHSCEESEILSYLSNLNSEEGYEHVAELKTKFGSRLYRVGE